MVDSQTLHADRARLASPLARDLLTQLAMITEPIPNGPKLLLPDHHREIEVACRQLLARTYADESWELIEQYRYFEREVLEHFTAEEEIILPTYGEHDPVDARAIRDDHTALRKMLYELGLEVELHIIRAESVERLIETLRAHAAREDAAMYPWAEQHLPRDAKRQLFGRITRSLRALANLAARGSQHASRAML